ncbi:MAG TPA: M1 family metallopeptidase [Terracidiphilus sp.]|nr:M1 family metallopeptidase [Terracidiphilus sp.]
MRGNRLLQVWCLLALVCFAVLLSAQESTLATSSYDPRLTFAPLTLPNAVNAYRSSDGMPGPAYWQNEADYTMHAVLDTKAKVLHNDEVITYTNNSPDALTCLWIHMEQNIYKPDARARIVNGGMRRRRRNEQAADGPPPSTNGFELESVTLETGKTERKVDYLIEDTRMQVRLPEPLRAKGGVLKLHIRYHYTIPGTWGGRTSWGMSKQGEIYDMAQWYPRMCVYDDIRGWDTLPYLGSEFYLEYGHFDYYVTVPSSMIVAGSGELMNPHEVLTAEEIARLAKARASDTTVMIRTVDEAENGGGRPKKDGTLTWHFHMDHTRDVVWSASPVFVWDAARINLPGGKTALAQSVYPPESVGKDRWDRSTEYVKDTVERFSRDWYPYPWPADVSVAGFSTGMEYPGMVFDGINDSGKFLFWVTAHEIGHGWFPMIVGSNERRHAFMDEGFNTFIDIGESAEFQGGVFGPKRDSEYSAGGEPPDMILKVLDNPAAPTLMMPADSYPWQLGHPVSYFKGAYGMVLLREQILGKERFDWAFRKYIRAWAFKHPSPSDFFRAMQSEGGEDLSWFWRGWYMNDWRFDMAIKAIDGDHLTIANKGQLVLPATVEVKFTDGTTTRFRVPVETWESKGEVVWNGYKPIASTTVDPDHMLPDDDRADNTMTAK